MEGTSFIFNGKERGIGKYGEKERERMCVGQRVAEKGLQRGS
jgi:hypothetical protein